PRTAPPLQQPTGRGSLVLDQFGGLPSPPLTTLTDRQSVFYRLDRRSVSAASVPPAPALRLERSHACSWPDSTTIVIASPHRQPTSATSMSAPARRHPSLPQPPRTPTL